eukprot:1515473-Rhodomonas_salina.1
MPCVLGGEGGLELSATDLSLAAASDAGRGLHEAGAVLGGASGGQGRVEKAAKGAEMVLSAPAAMEVQAGGDGGGEA